MRLVSVRSRLTLWYTASLSLIILVFSGGVFLFVNVSHEERVGRELKEHSDTIERILKLSPAETREEIRELMEYDPTSTFRVMEAGSQLAVTGSWKELGLERFPDENGALSPLPWTAPSGRHYRLQSRQIWTPGHLYHVTVAIDEDRANQLLRLLTTIMLISIPAAVVLAFAGGYFIAGRALAPVCLMAAKAREITAEGLAERLPVENPDDEFGRLATVFNKTFARLEESFERMRRFTADASHELRTPLTAIRSVGEVGLQKDNDANDCREVIASMLEETDRLTRLVDSLLILSRADGGTAPSDRTFTNLCALAADVIDCLQVLAEEKDQELVLECAEEISANVNPSTLRQALMNLVDNAVKYTQKRGRIVVSIRRTASGAVLLEVSDNGPGIFKEQQAKIFDRFYRIDRGRSREAGGTGLGLAIAQWAVEMNGGWIELESEGGRGSVFRVVLPEPDV